jgi:hypothetical protein
MKGRDDTGFGGKWESALSVTFLLPVGRVSLDPGVAPADGRMFIVPEDLGTPAGAVALRGGWNFQTPPGWDTVYTPIFNMIERYKRCHGEGW